MLSLPSGLLRCALLTSMKSVSRMSSFGAQASDVIPRDPLPSSGLFTPMFLSKSFTVLPFAFRSLS